MRTQFVYFCVVTALFISQIDCRKECRGRNRKDLRADRKNPRKFPDGSAVIQHSTTENCKTCEWEDCPDLNDLKRICPAGVVRDACGCCLECGSGPGMPCYLQGSWHGSSKFPPCGTDLECVTVSRDLEEDSNAIYRGLLRIPQGECMCLERSPLCGNNNKTYDNICTFRNAVPRSIYVDNFDLQILHNGPCVTAPKIYREPMNIDVEEGGSASFRCEVFGYPAPVVKWFRENKHASNVDIEFRDSYKFPASYLNLEMWELPGYFTNAVTQMRGGPGTYQLTSWLTVDDIAESDVGKYICHVSNEQGTQEAVAYLSLLNH